ncbi:MAG: type II secretory pathway, component PulD [Alcaligenaceae bacterium]
MRRFFLLFLFSSCVFASEGNVSVVFTDVDLMQLARVVFGEIAHDQVIFTRDAVQARDQVSLSLRNMSREAVVSEVRELLRHSGYSSDKRGSVVWIDKLKAVEDGEFIYKPHYRAVTYLVDLLSPLFKGGSFTLQRGLGSAQPQQIQQQQGMQGIQSQQPPIDSGTSVYSMMDKSPDVLVFKGSQKDIKRLLSLLPQIDSGAAELLVKAVIFEVSTSSNDRSALGLAASLLGGKLGVNIGSNVAAGDYSAVFKSASLQVVFDVLSTDSRFKVVSTPTLRVKSGSSARLTVGNETPVLGAIQYDSTGKSVQSIEYRPSGVILDLKPQIREDVAELQIDSQISNFIPTTNGVNTSPTLIKRQLSTSVGVHADEVLVLGGLDQDQNTDDKIGPAFLPEWLRPGGHQKSKSEVLLILQAQRI